MEELFTSLNRRQAMLLLTSVTFGGQESLSALDFLPEEESQLLKHRAQQMLQVPREKRIPLLVQEIKRLVTARRGALWAADPQKLAEVLRGERSSVVEMLLRAFPENLAEAVRVYLPDERVQIKREVRPEVVNILRWKLEEVLERAGARRAHFKFSDVLLLQSRELLTVCDHLGARALAAALAGLPEAECQAFIDALPPDQRQLCERFVAGAAQRRLDERDAREVLQSHDAAKSSSDAIRSVGAQRLARACLAQSAEFAARLLERYRGEFGQLLGKWVREERQRAVNRGDGGRSEIVLELEKLEQKGLVAKPVRLPPPSQKPSTGTLQKPSLPAPSPRLGSSSPRPTGVLPPPAGKHERKPSHVSPPEETESEARHVGGAPARSKTELPRRDPVAERAARRAGALGYRPPSGDKDATDSLPQNRSTAGEFPVVPPPTRPPPDRKSTRDAGTSVARPPRSRTDTSHRRSPGRGSKGESE